MPKVHAFFRSPIKTKNASVHNIWIFYVEHKMFKTASCYYFHSWVAKAMHSNKKPLEFSKHGAMKKKKINYFHVGSINDS